MSNVKTPTEQAGTQAPAEAPQLKTYRVTFTDTSCMRIDMEAMSPDDAISKAEDLYLEEDADDPRFVAYGGDAFQDPDATEVQS